MGTRLGEVSIMPAKARRAPKKSPGCLLLLLPNSAVVKIDLGHLGNERRSAVPHLLGVMFHLTQISIGGGI